MVVDQIIRFVIGGGIATTIGVTVYALVALVLGWHPQIGNLLAYAIGMLSGYLMHSQWSFRGHGSARTNSTRLRFIAASLAGFSINGIWVWLCTEALRVGPVWPILPMLFVTPAITFTLNRNWVFR